MTIYRDPRSNTKINADDINQMIRNPPKGDELPFAFSFTKYDQTHVAQVHVKPDTNHRTTNISISLGRIENRLSVNLVCCHRDFDGRTMYGVAVDQKIITAVDHKTAFALLRALRRSYAAGYTRAYTNPPANIVQFDLTDVNVTAWHLITAMTSGRYYFSTDRYGDAALYVDPDPENRGVVEFSTNTVKRDIGGAATAALFKKAVEPYHAVPVDQNLTSFILEHDGKAVVPIEGKVAYMDDDNFTLFTALYSGS